MNRVAPSEEGMTLLSFLKARCPEASSVKAIKRAIENKGCTVNGQIETFSSHPVRAGDQIAIDLSLSEKKPSAPWPILYEDEALCICNKPAGALSQNKGYMLYCTQPETWNFERAKTARIDDRKRVHISNIDPFTIVDSSEFSRSSKSKFQAGCSIVHRLDKETSGALVFAKTPAIKEKMVEIFRKHQVVKTYLAIVEGALSQDQGEISAPLGKVGEYQGQTLYGVVAPQAGRRALTRWKCLKKNARASLLQLEPVTGRTHQLRVHLSHLHHPILGDAQYGKHFRTLSLCRPKRHLLHAYAIAFPHPVSGEPLKVIAPIPQDFKEALQQLQLHHP